MPTTAERRTPTGSTGRGGCWRHPSGSADLAAVAAAVTRLAECARSLGRAMRTVEVNPLWVDGSQVEALDVLVRTGPATGPATGAVTD